MSSNDANDSGPELGPAEPVQIVYVKPEPAASLSEETLAVVVAASTTAAYTAAEIFRSELTTPGAEPPVKSPPTGKAEEPADVGDVPPVSELFKADERQKLSDYWIRSPEKSIQNDQLSFHRKVLTRVSAKEVTFRNVSFFQTVFDSCYFNHCVFDSCNFIGCRFVACNLNQSSFPGCKFDYAIFERSQIDDDILKSTPERNNLKLKFARTLRMNYQQIGDARAVNQAIVVELEATSIFLKESWASSSEYYRKKYSGLLRVRQFFQWCEFRILDKIWGNGESVAKLLRAIFVVILAVGLVDAIYFPGTKTFFGFIRSFAHAPALFLGVKPLPETMPSLIAATVAALRLVSFAFLTAILVKRFGRR